MKKAIKKTIFVVLFLLASIMIVGARYYEKAYADQTFDQIIYYLVSGVENTSPDVVKSVISANLLNVIILFLLISLFAIKNVRNKLILNFNILKKRLKIQLFPIKLTANHRIIYTLVILITAIVVFIKGFKIDEFVIGLVQETDMYDKYYVGANSSYITFPDEKRNLIFISLESMETSLCSKENGGGWDYSIIPELEELALENISFSNTDDLGGAMQVSETHYTAAALVAQTGGIPLKATAVTIDTPSGRYNGNGRYLENVYAIGDVLKEQGYNLEIMMGSDGRFGARSQFFETNGGYKVFDVNSAIADGKMSEEERVWWGFEDDKLYKWAKEEILDLASKDEPFNFIMQTADTHFVDGYLSEYAENKFDTQYENVFAYSSKCVYEFVEWLKEQDFYESTTIVILGDHLGKQAEFYEAHLDKDYERTIYNVIINSAIEGSNMINRKFASMDFYPTMLASIGVEIKGDRLGLGTNLFSDTKTLIEELGFDYINTEAKKNSTFYNVVLLGKDYYYD